MVKLGLLAKDQGSLNIEIFLYLQLLDFLTTLLGLRLGANEASPLVRTFLAASPALGVVLSKAIAIGLGGVCIRLNKTHIIRWINYWYAALVLWNIAIIFRLLSRAP